MAGDYVWSNHSGSSSNVTYTLNWTESGDVRLALPGEFETPLQWLERRVNEIRVAL